MIEIRNKKNDFVLCYVGAVTLVVKEPLLYIRCEVDHKIRDCDDQFYTCESLTYDALFLDDILSIKGVPDVSAVRS